MIAGQKSIAGNNHVDFVGAISHGAARFFKFRAQRILAARKPVATEATWTREFSPRNRRA